MKSPRFEVIPIAKIHPSNTNPRKRFPVEWIDELTSSIKDVGIMQPILVRKHPEIDDDFQIVSGECRYKASVAAGIESMPAMIRELTDGQMLKLQILENLKRQDVHPMEQAEGFQYLLEHESYKAEQLADEIGVSRSTIYASLKLCALCTHARDAFYEGKLTPSTALLIARIPGEKLQVQAMKTIIEGDSYSNWEPLSYRKAKDHILGHYTLSLKKAVFDIQSADLVPAAGSCIACPKRSGNSPEQFPDIKNADVCTDPECFAQKRDACLKRVAGEGKRVISGQAAEKVMPYPGSAHNLNSGYVNIDSRCDLIERKEGEDQKSFRDLLGDNLPRVSLLAREGAEAVDVAKKDALAQALIAAGFELKKTRAEERTDSEKQAEKETIRRKELYFELAGLTLPVLDNDKHGAIADQLLIAIVQRELSSIHGGDLRLLCQAFNNAPDMEYGQAMLDVFKESVATMRGNQLLQLLALCSCIHEIECYSWNVNNKPEHLSRLRSILKSASPPPSAAQAQVNDAADKDENPLGESSHSVDPDAQTAPAAEPAAQAAESKPLGEGFAKARAKTLARKAKEQKQKEPAKAGSDDSAAATATA